MFAHRNPVQPGGGKSSPTWRCLLPRTPSFFFPWPSWPTSSCQSSNFFFFFELPLGIEHSLLEKILGSVTHKEFTLIVSNNRLMSTGSTKKWKDPDQGAIQGRPPSLSWLLASAKSHQLYFFRNSREMTGWEQGRAVLRCPPISENFWLLLNKSLEKLNWQEIPLSYKVANVVKSVFKKGQLGENVLRW